MSALTLNHAATRPLKTRLYADSLAALRAFPGHIYSHPLYDESAIVAQVERKPVLIAVHLPGRTPSEAVLATMRRSVAAGGIAFVVHVHEAMDVARLLTRFLRAG